ncbi:MAG: DMT family transporter [Eubacteriales bacterium]|nr:DMT family transporter [Eubacteriales bacterium]
MKSQKETASRTGNSRRTPQGPDSAAGAGAKPAVNTADRGKGILFILLAAFFFSMMSVFVRLSGDVPTMQKAFFRNIVATVVAAVLLLRSGEGFSIRKSSLPALFLRSAFGTAGIIANFWAVDHLGIADANMLNKLSPFFAILMSIFILREIPNRIEWLSVLFAFIGAAFVAKPSSGIISVPAMVGILGGFTAGTAYTFVRKLGLQGVKGPMVVAFFSAFSTLVLLPNLLLHYSPMSARQLVFLLLAGCSAAGGQLGITAAYQHAPARDISVFDYSQVVYAALFGFFLFGEMPDGWSLLGYVIIIGTAFAKWYLLTRD